MKTLNRRILRVLVALAGAAAIANPAHADISYLIGARGRVTDGWGPSESFDLVAADSSATASVLSNTVSDFRSMLAGFSRGQAVAVVRHGYFNLAAEAEAVSGVPGNFYVISADASASATFSDTVVLNAPGMAGMTGTFTPILQVHTSGEVNTIWPPEGAQPWHAQYGLNFTIGDQTGSTGGSLADGGGVFTLPIAPVTFTYGVPFTIAIEGSVWVDGGGSAEVPPDPSGSAFAAFPGSVHWLGMEGLPDGTVVEQGAINWMEAAPVPGVPTLACLAPMVLLGGRRRRS